jgi:hypothetical protein
MAFDVEKLEAKAKEFGQRVRNNGNEVNRPERIIARREWSVFLRKLPAGLHGLLVDAYVEGLMGPEEL